MACTAAARFWSQLRAAARIACCRARLRLILAGGLFLLALAGPAAAQSDPVKGEVTFAANGGYARMVVKLAREVGVDVATAGSIVVIRFERPVDLSADRLAEEVPDYVNSARADPDGMGLRLSLARRVTINTMSAGERVFIDFLPDSWKGPPPSLPVEVVRELAERARVAERALRQQRAEAAAKKRPPIRVRALVQPTFVRFVFEMPDGVGASSIFNEQKLTVSFNGLLNFDLADAKIAAPPNVAAINQRIEGDSTLVELTMIGDVDVHSFREDRTYNIDVGFQPDRAKSSAIPVAEAGHGQATPAATSKPEMKPEKEAAPPHPAGEIKPPTSESIAQQTKAEAKSEINAAPVTNEPAKEPAKEAARPTEPAPAPWPVRWSLALH
jgi:hypothetical protein